MQSRMPYRPEIDGLRGIAVLGVLLFHAGLGLPGGFVGVDVFFVISGYLITSLILSDINQGTFSLVAFWERRIRRLLPALLVVTFTTLAAGWALLLPDDFRSLSRSVVALALVASNVHFWRDTHYFGGAADEKPLLHTWSLAVEEQFYIVLPLLFLALGWPRQQRLLRVMILVSAAASF